MAGETEHGGQTVVAGVIVCPFCGFLQTPPVDTHLGLTVRNCSTWCVLCGNEFGWEGVATPYNGSRNFNYRTTFLPDPELLPVPVRQQLITLHDTVKGENLPRQQARRLVRLIEDSDNPDLIIENVSRENRTIGSALRGLFSVGKGIGDIIIWAGKVTAAAVGIDLGLIHFCGEEYALIELLKSAADIPSRIGDISQAYQAITGGKTNKGP